MPPSKFAIPSIPDDVTENDPAPGGVKRGVLSNKDKYEISKRYLKDSIADISMDLKRSPKLIIEFIRTIESDNPNTPLLLELRSHINYRSLKEEFSTNELALFEQKFIEYSKQFPYEDFTELDKNQLQSYLRGEIRLLRYHRTLRLRAEEQFNMETQLTQLLQSQVDKPAHRLLIKDEIQEIRERLSEIMKAIGQLNTWIKDAEATNSRLLKDLKTTRDQRIDKNNDGTKRNFSKLIRDLMDDEFRRRDLEHSKLMRTASRKSLKTLGSPTKFADGSIEIPILTSETFGWEQDALETDETNLENFGAGGDE